MKFFNTAYALCTTMPLVVAVAIPPAVELNSVEHVESIKNIERRGMYTTYFRPWPLSEIYKVDGRPMSTIPYCYVNQEAEDKLRDNFEDAIDAWYEALGDPDGPSKQAGHTVKFLQFTQHCYTGYVDLKNPGTWNLPAGYEWALTVHYSTKEWKATLGFKQYNNNPGRHYIVLGDIPEPDADGNQPKLQLFIHELGHVMGLVHEHQHPDAHRYIKLRPENIDGYHVAIAAMKLIEHFKHWTPEQIGAYISGDDPRGREWGQAMGYAYTEYWLNGPHHAQYGPYDPLSTMHYASSCNGAIWDWEEGAPFDPSKCDITKLAPNGDEVPQRVNSRPSQGDVNNVKAHYPWDNPHGQ